MRSNGAWKTFGWGFLALVMSLGVGGIVAGADHPAGDDTRPELTARADSVLAPRLASMVGRLEELEAQVVELGGRGRAALTHLTARRVDKLVAELDAGRRLLDAIEGGLADLRARYEELPYGPDSDRVGRRTRERMRLVAEAIETLQPLSRSWNSLSVGSVPAIELAEELERHDEQVFEATREGTRGRYGDALGGIRLALRILDRAIAIRNVLSTTPDVSTLDDWLRRARVYDDALLRLYTLLDEPDGEMTEAARQALDAVERAQAALPADTDSLVVVMADIAQGGLNQAVIDIERARGSLSEALVGLRDDRPGAPPEEGARPWSVGYTAGKVRHHLPWVLPAVAPPLPPAALLRSP